MKIKNLLGVITILLIGCLIYLGTFPKKDDKLKGVLLEQLRKTTDGGMLDLTKFTDFEWSVCAMIYSDSGVNKSAVKEMLGIDHYGIGHHKNRYYFLYNGQLVKFFDSRHFDSANIWMSGCRKNPYFAKVGYEDAKFFVQREKCSSGTLLCFKMTAVCE